MPRSKEAAMRRKKKGKFTKKESPFPIPVPSLPGEPAGSWFYYTGFIEGSTVVVKHSGDMDFLYRMGFFGKGTLSRSQPNFRERRQKVNIELPQRNGHYKVVQAVVVNKRSYLAHKRFKALADGKMKEYSDIVYQEEQQQAFLDSSDDDVDDEEEEEEEEEEEKEEEEEEEEEEEMMDEDSSDDDSISSADVDSGKTTAFKLLSQENSLESGQKNASTSFAANVDISVEVRSHIVSMLGKIQSLSNEQITTFMQVPQGLKYLAERYKKLRKAEVNKLQQVFAAKFPGRNFRKGEVITLDEDDCAPASKPCGDESDNAVVISDSDDVDGEDKGGNNGSGLKRSQFDDNNKLGQGNDAGEKVFNKKVVSSKKDLADWSSDDSNFWSEEPQVSVKDTSHKLQIAAAEEMIVLDSVSKTVELCHDVDNKKSKDVSNDGKTAGSTDIGVSNDEDNKRSVDLSNDEGNKKSVDVSDDGKTAGSTDIGVSNDEDNKRSVDVSDDEDNKKSVDLSNDENNKKSVDLSNDENNKKSVDLSNDEDNKKSVDVSDDGKTAGSTDIGVSNDEDNKKSVDVSDDGKTAGSADIGDSIDEDSKKSVDVSNDGKTAENIDVGDSNDEDNKKSVDVSSDGETVGSADMGVSNDEDKKSVDVSSDGETVGSTDNDQKLGEISLQSVANKLKKEDGNEVNEQQTDTKNITECNNIVENKSTGETNSPDANGVEAGDVRDDKNSLPSSLSQCSEDNAISLAISTNDSVPSQKSVSDVSSEDKLVMKGDDKFNDNEQSNITIQSTDMERCALNSTLINGSTNGSCLKDNLDIKQENSLNSSGLPSEADGLKTDEVSTTCDEVSETLASASECIDMLDQSCDSGTDKAVHGVNETECIKMLDQSCETGIDKAVSADKITDEVSTKCDKVSETKVPASNCIKMLDQSCETGTDKAVSGVNEDESTSECIEMLDQSCETDTDKAVSGVNEVVCAVANPIAPETITLDTEDQSDILNSDLKICSFQNVASSSHPSKEKSKTNIVVGLQIDTSVTNSENSVEDTSVVLSNSVENVTNIDSDNSNDSDDVICIESKSAEPKKLHNFLSQPVKKILVPVVTKSVTFMSSITEEPTFVSASVGFQSWGPLLHFNFTGDPSHLPTALAVSSSPSEPAEQRAPQNGQSQHSDIVYERIYPPIISLVPNGNSTGAVIKQRLRGLPFLSTAYSQVMQAQETGSAVESSPQKNYLKELATSKPSQPRFQPYTRMLMDQRPPMSSSTPKTAASHSLDSKQSCQRASSDAPRVTSSHLSSYVKAFQSGSKLSTDQTEIQDGAGNARNISSLLVSLLSIIVKISKIYDAVSSKDTPNITSDDQEKDKSEEENVLAEFHKALSHYLPSVEISPTLETHLLSLLLSGKLNNSEDISDKDIMDTKSSLSDFHMWLLQKRFEYLKKNQQGENNDLKKVVVVDLTSNSDDKVHVSHPELGFEGNVVVDLTEKSLNDSVDSKFEKKIAGDLIVDPVIKIDSFVKSTVENDSVLDLDDSVRDSDGSRQQSQMKSEADSVQISNSENKRESLSEENILGELSEGQISVDLLQESKSESLGGENITEDLSDGQMSISFSGGSKCESLSGENVCKILHEESTEGVSDGNVFKSLSKINVIEKLNDKVCDRESEGKVSENISEGNVNKNEETVQNSEVVSEETPQHSHIHLETENRKRKFERSDDDSPDVNVKKLKSDEDRLLGINEEDEKTCTSSRSEDHKMDTDDDVLIGSNGHLEAESKSLVETQETAVSASKAGSSPQVLGQECCLLDKPDVKARSCQELESGQQCLDTSVLVCESTDQDTRDTDQLLTKEDPGLVKDAMSDSGVSSMELTIPSEVEHMKTEPSDSSDAQTLCHQGPSGDSAEVETKKEDQLLKETQSSLGDGGDPSTVTLEDDSVEKMDITMACEAKQDIDSDAADNMSNKSSSLTGLKTEKLIGNGEGSVEKVETEQSTDVINCLVSSDSDSEDVSCVSAIEKPKPHLANVDVNSMLKKVPEKKEAPEMPGKGSLPNPSTSEDIHIFIGSSSDEAEEPPAKRHTSQKPLAHGVHPYSARDEPDGNLFVVANTSDEDYEEGSDDDEGPVIKKTQKRWRSCVKQDPYPTQEKLHLMLEEAFFLSFGLGCLRILDPEMKLLDLTQMWQQFQVLKEQFVPHYVAYHHFRSQGWIPKPGLKFGCDLILYREGPPFYHGSYSVVVIAVKDTTLLPVNTHGGVHLDNRKFNWVSLAGLNRITEHVAKELMLCYVIWPANMTYEESLSPDCISRFKVKELVVSRWVSSQERENKFGEEEMP